MITDVLLDHAALVRVLLLVVAACVLVALRSGRPGVRARTALLVPAGAPRVDDVRCTVPSALPTLGRVELLADVALASPPASLGALRTAVRCWWRRSPSQPRRPSRRCRPSSPTRGGPATQTTGGGSRRLVGALLSAVVLTVATRRGHTRTSATRAIDSRVM